ncbi:MAG: hypothetical protein QF722_04270 [Candidatus Thalassarchaeaceae archaeon]|jgi:hypothetical protein|nr:hypothetical protein [Candidatus Thalassarchaeaceae archaeon]MDP6844749.1 hypothetical protein [Candidatus Thalassarchaeaceae archaeon]
MQTQAPWSSGDSQTPGQVVIGAGQPQVITGQPTNQQVIYVQAPAFKPSPNYRHISYIVIAIGIGLSILISVMAEISGLGSYFATQLTNTMCCGSLGIACIVDAMYYNDKSNWQQQTGADTTSTTIGMIADIVFAVICLGIAFLFLLGIY